MKVKFTWKQQNKRIGTPAKDCYAGSNQIGQVWYNGVDGHKEGKRYTYSVVPLGKAGYNDDEQVAMKEVERLATEWINKFFN